MVGILVHGSNHFIVRGPLPDRATALALVRHGCLIQIGEKPTPLSLQQWRISRQEFRENLEWAVVVPGDGETSPAVAQLLGELTARGLTHPRLLPWRLVTRIREIVVFLLADTGPSGLRGCSGSQAVGSNSQRGALKVGARIA